MFFSHHEKPVFSDQPLTLERGKADQKVRIIDISGGWGIRQHLNQLGLHVGSVVHIKQACSYGGPVLITSNRSEIAIGNRMARNIKILLLDA